MLVIMAGLPGTGKTHVASAIAAKLRAHILSKDTVRHALFAPDLVEYSVRQDDFVVDQLLRTTEYLWARSSKSILILDGRTFSQRSQREHVIQFAQEHQQATKIVECICDESVAKQRLSRIDPTHPAGNRNPQLYDEVKTRWQEIPQPKIIVCTDSEPDFESIAQQVIA